MRFLHRPQPMRVWVDFLMVKGKSFTSWIKEGGLQKCKSLSLIFLNQLLNSLKYSLNCHWSGVAAWILQIQRDGYRGIEVKNFDSENSIATGISNRNSCSVIFHAFDDIACIEQSESRSKAIIINYCRTINKSAGMSARCSIVIESISFIRSSERRNSYSQSQYHHCKHQSNCFFSSFLPFEYTPFKCVLFWIKH